LAARRSVTNSHSVRASRRPFSRFSFLFRTVSPEALGFSSADTPAYLEGRSAPSPPPELIRNLLQSTDRFFPVLPGVLRFPEQVCAFSYRPHSSDFHSVAIDVRAPSRQQVFHEVLSLTSSTERDPLSVLAYRCLSLRGTITFCAFIFLPSLHLCQFFQSPLLPGLAQDFRIVRCTLFFPAETNSRGQPRLSFPVKS